MLVERIKNLADGKNMTLAAIERQIGLGQGTIRKWDTNMPSVDKLLKVANLLCVTTDFLLTGSTIETSVPPSSTITKDEELRVIEYYRRLNVENQDYIKGEMIKLYKQQESDKGNNERYTRGVAT